MRVDVALDCGDLVRAEAFRTPALAYERVGSDGQYVVLRPAGGRAGVQLLLQEVPEGKAGKNRMHLDVSVPDVEAEVARLRALGATPLRDEPFEELGHRWFQLADRKGNEFCVCAE